MHGSAVSTLSIASMQSFKGPTVVRTFLPSNSEVPQLWVSYSSNGSSTILNVSYFDMSVSVVVSSNSSRIWGLSSMYDGTDAIIYSDTASDMLMTTNSSMCGVINLSSFVIPAQQCNSAAESPAFSIKPYMSTTGDSVFLDEDFSIVDDYRLPPSTVVSRKVVHFPHETHQSPESFPRQQQQPQPSPPLPSPRSVEFFIKTPKVYKNQCRIQSAFVVRYSTHLAERPSTSNTKLIITAKRVSIEIPCVITMGEAGGGFSSSNYYGTCTTNSISQCANLSFDGTNASATFQWGANTYAPETHFLVLEPHAATMNSGGDGIYIDARNGAMLPNDTFAFKVYANSSKYPLYQWGIRFKYDPSLLSFLSLETAPGFVDAVVTLSSSANTVSANTRSSGGTPLPPSGDQILLATVTMRVAASVPLDGRLYGSAVQDVEALFLVNVNNNQFVTNGAAVVYDAAEPLPPHLSNVSLLMDNTSEVVGAYWYSPFPYVIHKPDRTSIPCNLFLYYITKGYSSSPVLSYSQQYVGNQPGDDDLQGQIIVRVFKPHSTRLVVHPETRRIRYMVRWMGHPDGMVAKEVDVMNTAYHVVPNATVPLLRNGVFFAPPLSNYSVTIQMFEDSVVQQQQQQPPSPASVHIDYYKSVDWSTETLSRYPLLSKEGDSHTLIAVDASNHFLVQFASTPNSSSHPESYAITVPSLSGLESHLLEDNYAFHAYVPAGAPDATCITVAPLNGNVEVNIVGIKSMSMCCSDESIVLSPADDPLILTGTAQSSMYSLTASITYADDFVVDVTNDPRTTYIVVSNTCGATFEANNKDVASVQNDGVIQIRATFDGGRQVVSPVLSFSCVVTMGVEAYMEKLGGDATTTDLLSPIACSNGKYQSGRGQAKLLTSAADSKLVPIDQSHVTFSVANETVMKKSYGNNGFTGVSAGSTVMIATVGPFTGSVPITVSSTEISVSSIVLSREGSNTFLGAVGAEETLHVKLDFSDGTSISDIFANWPDYTQSELIPDLLSISTNDESEINVTLGKAVLLDNSHQPVTLTASLRCGSSLPSSIQVIGNIDLTMEGDVDIGQLTGLPIPIIPSSSLGVPLVASPLEVRLRVTSASLKAFDLLVHFDPVKVHVDSCSNVGSMWAGSFGCTINNVQGYVQIIGADVNSNVKNSKIKVASLVLMPISSGITRISGEVIKISTSLTSKLDCPMSECQFSAGSIPFLIGSATRAYKSGGGGVKRRRHLLTYYSPSSPSEVAYGDTNGDTVFDISDYLFAQEYYNDASILGCPSSGGVGCQLRSDITMWQDAQLRPVGDPNAPTGGRDLFYLFNTYADKLRFVVDVDFRTSAGFFHFGVKLVDRKGNAASSHDTRVLFAFRSSLQELQWTGSRYDAATGLVLYHAQPAAEGEGWFEVEVGVQQPNDYNISFPESMLSYTDHFIDEQNMGVAFSVETVDAELNWDAVDPLRRSPFFAIHAESYSIGFDEFRPYALVNLTSMHQLICDTFFSLNFSSSNLYASLENMENKSDAYEAIEVYSDDFVDYYEVSLFLHAIVALRYI